jgi:Thermopsin/zinc-ribbon domain
LSAGRLPFCTNCGELIPKEAVYCPNCGQAVHVSRVAPAHQQVRVKKSHFVRNAAILVIVILIALIGFSAYSVFSSLSTYVEYPVYVYGSFGHYLQNPAVPAPTGLGVFGLKDTSGAVKPYVVHSNAVLASASIQSLAAYNSSLPRQFQHGAGLQLNTMLAVNTTSAAQQVYWLQNTVEFQTSNLNVVTPRDQVENLTTLNSSIIASGIGVTSTNNGQQAYIGDVGRYSYSLPLNITLGITVSVSQGGVEVDFYNSPFGQPNSTNPCENICPQYKIDSVSLAIPDVQAAAIEVTPYQLVIGYLPYDTEITWGGPCCGYTTTFTQMNSTLSLWYNGTNGQTYFPSYFTFGGDTGEFATNLAISPTSTGGQVAVGNQRNSPLS